MALFRYFALIKTAAERATINLTSAKLLLSLGDNLLEYNNYLSAKSCNLVGKFLWRHVIII